MTVDDGSVLDSRQPIQEDDGCRVMRRSLATSWLWWEVTSSLVMPILEDAGPDAFALVIGERSVVELRSDGSLKRIGLKGLLQGGTSTIELVRTGMRDRELPDEFELVTDLGTWNGESVGKIGVKGAGPGAARWRFLNGNEFYLARTGSKIAPKVIVDTGDAVMGGITVETTDFRFGALQGRRLFNKGVVSIFPHTHCADHVVRAYAGQPLLNDGTNGVGYHRASKPWDPSDPRDPMEFTRMVPVIANFGVSGVVVDRRWENPEDLEAARSMLSARFDLNIGIWDLVNNPVLRQTLLQTVSQEKPPQAAAPVPVGPAGRGRKIASARDRERLEGRTQLDRIRKQTDCLRRAGWVDGGVGLMTRPLTDQVKRWETETEASPLLWLSLDIRKRQATVNAITSMYNQIDLQSYLEDRRGQLELIARMGLAKLDNMWPVLWFLDQGWADKINWSVTFQQIASMTNPWINEMEDMAKECMRHVR